MKKSTILIANGDIYARLQIINCLKKLVDVEYIEASDGRSALTHILEDDLDLVLLDLDLSVIAGIEILKKIKRSPNEKIRNIPILIFSAIKEKSIVKQVILLGIEGYIVRPSSDDDIVSRIANVVLKDETKTIIEKIIKPKLTEIFGNVIAGELISKASVLGMTGSSKNEKIKLIIEGICSDQRYIGMMGTSGVRKQKDDWSSLLK